MQWWKFRRKVHSSWLVALLSLGIVIGVMMAQYAPLWFGSISWLFVGVCLLAAVFWRRYVYLLPVVLVAGVLIGLWRGSVDYHQLQPYQKLIGYSATIQGVVTEDPEIDEKGGLTMRLSNLLIDDREMAGKLWVSSAHKRDVKRGDRVTIVGKLTPGFGTFSASIFRADIAKVQRPQPGDIAGRVRDDFASNIRKAIPEPEASLGVGYLVGQRRALPPELDEALVIAGLTHIVVASGYNLTILVRFTRRLFVRISKYLAVLSAGGLIVVFIAISGMSPSMSRAGLVAGLSLLAWYYGRKFHPLVLLPFVAAVTLLVNPSYGWSDLGWQLSFAAFAGVMILAPLLQRYFFGDKKPSTVRQILGETISAQVVTLPLLILAFGQFSNVAIIANLLVLPLVPLAMLLTFISGVGVIVFPSIASFIGVPATWILEYMTSVTRYLAGAPWAQTSLEVSGIIVGVYYIILIGVCLYVWRKTRLNLRDANIIE